MQSRGLAEKSGRTWLNAELSTTKDNSIPSFPCDLVLTCRSVSSRCLVSRCQREGFVRKGTMIVMDNSCEMVWSR